MTIVFAGNPNCGKTTLFNAYTGASLKVANWPGVTVEKKEGTYTHGGRRHTLVDLPGIYSLSTYTLEEKLSRQFLLEGGTDVIVDVADAGNIGPLFRCVPHIAELWKLFFTFTSEYAVNKRVASQEMFVVAEKFRSAKYNV